MKLSLKKIFIFTSLFSLFFYSCSSKNSKNVPNSYEIEVVEDFQDNSMGTNPGNLIMNQFIPDNMPEKAPLVVVLHGCNVSASFFAKIGGWNQLAQKYKFYVLYPEQTSSNNITSCFNWFNKSDTEKGKGEVHSIYNMIKMIKANYSIDDKKVFINGMSAGGTMSLAMMSIYPELFNAGSVMSGLPFRAAVSPEQAIKAMIPGIKKTPSEWGNLVKKAKPGYKGKYPKLIIFHGTKDYVSVFNNMNEILEQWTNIHNIDQTPDETKLLQGYPYKIYKDKKNMPVIETVEITKMAHFLAVDPGKAKHQGGVVLKAERKYTMPSVKDVNIYTPYWTLKFWGLAK